MNALAIHLYLIIRYINLSFNYFCNFYRIIDYFISRNKDTLKYQFLLSCLFIIYSPFYSFRVLKKDWIK